MVRNGDRLGFACAPTTARRRNAIAGFARDEGASSRGRRGVARPLPDAGYYLLGLHLKLSGTLGSDCVWRNVLPGAWQSSSYCPPASFHAARTPVAIKHVHPAP